MLDRPLDQGLFRTGRGVGGRRIFIFIPFLSPLLVLVLKFVWRLHITIY